MAGRVLQKFLDFHRNQQSILHIAHLKEGEKRREENEIRSVCVCAHVCGE